MKSIETSYGGYRFRSRLEARWAVCFDTMDVGFRYEPEGLQVSWPLDPARRTQRLYWLPDFYIPGWDVYVEVKAAWTAADRWKFYNIAASLDKPVLLAGDFFRVSRAGEITLPWKFVMGDRLYAGDPWPCPIPRTIQVANTRGEELTNADLLRGIQCPVEDYSHWREGYRAAQRARFEHGEAR